MSDRNFWYGTSGPPDSEICVVAESWGVEEEKVGKPLVGTSGQEFDRILAAAGLDRNRIFCTNMVPARPQSNETWRFFLPKVGNPTRLRGLAPSEQVKEGIRQLYHHILAYDRKVVVAAGNYALWSLTGVTGSHVIRESNKRAIAPELQTWVPNGIMDWRGSMWYIEPIRELCVSDEMFEKLRKVKLLPIVHPAAIQRAWYNREPTIHDLKARVPLALKDDWRPKEPFEFWAPPDYQRLINLLRIWRKRASEGRLVLAGDCETCRTLMTCFGLADSPNFAVSIPFVRKTGPGAFDSWWTPSQEAEILTRLRDLLMHPNVFLIGQNFLYDLQYTGHWWGFQPKLSFDTMLAQNVMFPGTPKGLDYLSSLYVHYHWFWKEDHKEWDEKGTVEQLLAYNCLDCVRTWETAESQEILLKHLGMEPQMQLKMEINGLCLRMMNRGVRIDTKRRGEIAGQLMTAVDSIKSELHQIVPQSMVWPDHKTPWYNSAKQTSELFYDVFGFREVRDPKTGARTSGKKALMQLKRWYPEFTGLFDRLDTMGSAENTATVLQAALDSGSRMRCFFGPGGTETHRLNSSKNAFGRGTNLQNLTKGEEDE